MSAWKAGEGRTPDPVEAALEAASSKAAVRRTALIAAGVAFSTAVFAAAFFASRPPSPDAAVSVPSLPPPPGEISTIVIDRAGDHSLPYRKFGVQKPAVETRGLAAIEPRKKETVKRAAAKNPVNYRPAAIAAPVAAADDEKPSLEDKLTSAKPNGGNFIGGASVGGGGQIPAAGRAQEEDAAAAAFRDPGSYAAKEQAQAMRALQAVLQDGGKLQQIIERDKPQIYQASEAAPATQTQDHGGVKKKKSALAGAPGVVPTLNGLALPQNMQAELERLGREYEKRKK